MLCMCLGVGRFGSGSEQGGGPEAQQQHCRIASQLPLWRMFLWDVGGSGVVDIAYGLSELSIAERLAVVKDLVGCFERP